MKLNTFPADFVIFLVAQLAVGALINVWAKEPAFSLILFMQAGLSSFLISSLFALFRLRRWQ